MAWTAPRTWVIGEILTAALLNTHLRDNLLETAPAKVTTAGDIVYATAANALARLGIGTAGQLLRVNTGATAPQWATAPSARAYNSGNLSIPDNANTTLTFDSERWDTDTIHSTASNTSRLTAVTAGKYAIGAHVKFASNATGLRFIAILSAAVFWAMTKAVPVNGSDHDLSVVTLMSMAVNDYVEVVAYQNSGGPLNVLANGNDSPEFWMHWVGP